MSHPGPVARPFVRTLALAVAMATALTAAGCSGSSGHSTRTERTLVIGVEGPLTGDASATGLAAAAAVELAVKQANAKGDLPYRLRVERADDTGVADEASQAAQRLTDDARVVGVVGPLSELTLEKAGPIYAAAHVPTISLAPDNTGAVAGVEDILAPTTTLAQRAVDYLSKGVKAKSLAVVDDGTPPGTSLGDELQARAKAAGLQVSATSIAPTNDKGYATAAKRVVGANPNVVFYSGELAEGVAFAQALQGAGFRGIPVGGPLLTGQRFIDQAGKSAESWLTVCGCALPVLVPSAATFVRDYRAAYHQEPGDYAAAAYDAANTIIAALHQVKGDLTRESAGRALRAVSYQGITGLVKFDAKGQRTQAPVYVYEVKDGKRVLKGTVAELTAG